MFGLGVSEIIIILIAIMILFFGGKKLNEFARGLGKFTGEFKKGKMEIERELKNMEIEVTEKDSKEKETNNKKA